MNDVLVTKDVTFECEHCGGKTMFPSYFKKDDMHCDNPECPNMPCCGRPRENCECASPQTKKAMQMFNYGELEEKVMAKIAGDLEEKFKDQEFKDDYALSMLMLVVARGKAGKEYKMELQQLKVALNESPAVRKIVAEALKDLKC